VRSYIPGTLSPAYLNELKRLQDDLLSSITENPQETLDRAESERRWIEACHHPRRDNGAGNQEQPSSD
jgi:hypothetical protein